MRYIFSVFTSLLLLFSILNCTSQSADDYDNDDDDYDGGNGNVAQESNDTSLPPLRPPRTTMTSTTDAVMGILNAGDTSSSSTTTKSSTTLKTTPETETEIFEEQIVEDLHLAPVKDVRTCEVEVPSGCAKLCRLLNLSYRTSRPGPVNVFVILFIIVFFVFSISIAVLGMKLFEMRKAKSQLEINLSTLENLRMSREKIAEENLRIDSVDADPAKFRSKGHITIATNLDEALQQKCEDTNDVKLEKVEYDEKANEKYEIGSELDEFETISNKSGKSPGSRSNRKTKSRE